VRDEYVRAGVRAPSVSSILSLAPACLRLRIGLRYEVGSVVLTLLIDL
jgi:hypothetical protein